MNKPNCEDWPANELEDVLCCPYCRSTANRQVYTGVQDWSFGTAPGKWSYSECQNCACIYINPRPKESSMSTAYENYYTQGKNDEDSMFQDFRNRLKNEWISCLSGFCIEPRLSIPSFVITITARLFNKEKLPFGFDEIVQEDKGKFLDFGCGSGYYLNLFRKFGWDAMGVDADPLAVESARKLGLSVLNGSYSLLDDYPNYFDCVMCSHVLEHMHQPIEFLGAITNSLKQGGMLILSLPNSTSALRYYFGSDWRGLEAPRHISIPSQHALKNLLAGFGYVVSSRADTYPDTATESFRMKRRSLTANIIDRIKSRLLSPKPLIEDVTNDFIKFICIKK
jgi:2-polyprenyl-3-methyl-5-hydroxy-6-metoxy-1,4-benzoquinol methylase